MKPVRSRYFDHLRVRSTTRTKAYPSYPESSVERTNVDCSALILTHQTGYNIGYELILSLMEIDVS